MIRGTPKADRLFGLQGADKLYGRGGNDMLVGGAGNDTLVGGPGADDLDCGPGVDRAIADERDGILANCEVVTGLPGDPPPDVNPPPTQPPPPPTQVAVSPGAYRGELNTGEYVFFDVFGDRTISGFRVNDMRRVCDGPRYIYGALNVGPYRWRLQDDGSFLMEYDYRGSVSFTPDKVLPATGHVRVTGRIQGALAAGTAQMSTDYDDDGRHWHCATELKTWSASLMAFS